MTFKVWWLPADTESMTNLFTIGFDLATAERDFTVYRCSGAGCGFATTDPDSMGRHLRAHVPATEVAMFNERRGQHGSAEAAAGVCVDDAGETERDRTLRWAGGTRERDGAPMVDRRSEGSRAERWADLAGRSWAD